MSKIIDFTKPTFVLITGASQGIGRQIALDTAKKLTNPSKIVLLARSLDKLQALKQEIGSTHLDVIVESIDLTSPMPDDLEKILKHLTPDFQQVLLVHNIGSLGNVKVKSTELFDPNELNEFYSLNVSSVILLNSLTFKRVKETNGISVFVVNITSLIGRQPFKYLGMYGSAKAARDLFFKVVAEEEKDAVVLNYSPGPIKTDMYDYLAENLGDLENRNAFSQALTNKTILSTEQTVQMLLSILQKGDFKSGDIIDYYDRI